MTRAHLAPESRPEASNAERREFHTLDGLRGIAAIFIVSRHVVSLFSGVYFKESFLAVDLFFVLSGYVIAHAYDRRLAKGGFTVRFVILRLIRLYPLYLVGLTIGAAHIASLMLRHGNALWSPAKLGVAFGLNAVFLPVPPNIGSVLYPFDGPTWTLLQELVANFLFALLWRRLSNAVLIVVATVSGLAMVAAAVHFGTLDIGWQPNSFVYGYSRVFFSFPVGVLLFRLARVRHRLGDIAPWIALTILAFALGLNPGAGANVYYELVAALIGFPVLIWWASGIEPKHVAARRLMAQIGIASFAVYVLHAPAADLAQSVAHMIFKLDLWRYAPASGFGYLAALIALSVPLDRFYDRPLRAWLRRVSARTPKSAATPSGA